MGGVCPAQKSFMLQRESVGGVCRAQKPLMLLLAADLAALREETARAAVAAAVESAVVVGIAGGVACLRAWLFCRRQQLLPPLKSLGCKANSVKQKNI